MIYDIVIAILLFTAFGLLYYLFVSYKPKSQIEYEEKLKKSLSDEYIIDPETGTKLTLEQAESGHWLAHDNEFRKMPDSELEKLLSDEEKQVEIALNFLRESRDYLKTSLTEEQIENLSETKILNQYDGWTYSNSFKFKNGVVLLPSVELDGTFYYKESHVMFWTKIDTINGHYFFREKSSSEKFFDRIRNDDEIKFEDYECFTVVKSFNIIEINMILEKFNNQKGLEIEIKNDNLYVKTLKLVSLADIKRIEKIIKNICQ